MEESKSAFLEAALPHLDALYRLARHLTPSQPAAEDLVQETYLRAYAAFGSHRGPSTKAWLAAICLNLARSEGRRRTRRVVEEPLGEHDLAASEAVDDLAVRRVERARVQRALAGLPEEQRVAVVLMDLVGHTAAEVAELLGCPRNTVLSRVHRAHRRLAQALRSEDVENDLS